MLCVIHESIYEQNVCFRTICKVNSAKKDFQLKFKVNLTFALSTDKTYRQ